MPSPPQHSILLHRVDPERNMKRFYCLATMPTLFGETSLLRNWGRIGASGQMLVETFADPADAQNAMLRLATKKGRRGYQRPVSG